MNIFIEFKINFILDLDISIKFGVLLLCIKLLNDNSML